MRSKTQTIPLASEVSFLSGGSPRMSESRYWGGDIPWVSSGEMTQSRISSTERRVTEEGAQKGTKLVPANTVLVVVRGMSLAKEFRISISKREVTFNQDIKALRPSTRIDPWFLFYYLKSQRHAIRDSATDASHGTKKLETRVLEQWPLPVLDIQTQRAIASILSAYDDLIENNRRRIQLLEQAARLLYKEWFVHLRFPGHEHVKIKDGIPEGWEKKTIGELSPFKYGKALKQDDRIPGPYPVYGSSGIVGSHNKALVPGPAIIVGRKGNVGSVYWSKSDYYPIDTVYFIEAEHCSLYLYYALLHTQFISTDVAVPGLNRVYAHSRMLLVPESKILILFEQHAEVMHDQIERLTKYNESLASARDLLLPKLMNGEVVV
jgi:type I restriction enzyme S subunit